MLGRWLPGWSNRRAGNNGRAAGVYVSPRSVAAGRPAAFGRFRVIYWAEPR